MQRKFTDHNEFDKFVREQDDWIYDNGWNYKEEQYSAYMLEGFNKVNSGKSVEYIVMLRDDENSNKTIVLHGQEEKLEEIWSGFINSQDEYQAMMIVINEFIEEYRDNSGAI